MFTKVNSLRFSVGLENSSTPTTLLAGVSSRSVFYSNSFSHSLIFQELFKLVKIPFVQKKGEWCGKSLGLPPLA